MSTSHPRRDRPRRLLDLVGRRERADEPNQPSTLRTTHLRDGEVVDSRTVGLDASDTAADTALSYAKAHPDGLVVLGYDMPTVEQIAHLGSVWTLHPLLVEDLLKAGQRPKLERYGDVLFVVARLATYDDPTEDVQVTEFHLLVRRNVVAIMCQARGGQAVGDVHRIARDPEVLRLGPEAIVHSFLDVAVDGYAHVIADLEIDREEIERQVFDGDEKAAERIYRLSREIIDLQHAAVPLVAVVEALRAGFDQYEIDPGLRAYLQDVADHLTRVTVSVAELRDALAQILNVNATLVNQRQNENMKKISGWAAILFAPTLVGAIYGMNFDDMPELHWRFGYPMSILLMLGVGAGLWLLFRRNRWM
ncbi:magnesium and cobalt transport protein CorA [Sanguibacter sp. A247]|uniref:magnesium and cobalt transport protein CorA n=1 Tax=unclassified Sanguibacter TaxID=2645534 RepID=UPI003FD76A8B